MTELWHVTLVTHNSRYSQRMRKFHIKTGSPFWLEPEQEVALCRIIGDIVETYGITLLQFNICGDHVHFLLKTETEKLTETVKTLKSLSALKYKRLYGYPETELFQLWSQKFNRKKVDTPKYHEIVIKYITRNRNKHRLPDNPRLNKANSRIIRNVPND